MLAFLATTVGVSFAPGDVQYRWAQRHGIDPLRLTRLSGWAEVIGAVVNLRGDVGSGSAYALLDLVILADGTVRLLWSAMRRAPVGSVFAWPVRRLCRRGLHSPEQPPPSC
jgi:hypothetical protein